MDAEGVGDGSRAGATAAIDVDEGVGGLGGCDGEELAVHCGVVLAVVLVVLNFWLGSGVGLDFERGLG